MKKLSHRKSLKLSRLTDEQAQIQFNLNVQKEAWAMLHGNRNPVIKSIRLMVYNDIEQTQRKLSSNMMKCKRIVAPLRVIR